MCTQNEGIQADHAIAQAYGYRSISACTLRNIGECIKQTQEDNKGDKQFEKESTEERLLPMFTYLEENNMNKNKGNIYCKRNDYIWPVNLRMKSNLMGRMSGGYEYYTHLMPCCRKNSK